MDELTATSSRLATEIAVSEEEVSNNEKALQSAQALRAKQLTEFKADFKDPVVGWLVGWWIGSSESGVIFYCNGSVALGLTYMQVVVGVPMISCFSCRGIELISLWFGIGCNDGSQESWTVLGFKPFSTANSYPSSPNQRVWFM